MPTPLRVLEGNRSQRRIPEEPAATPGPCDPPAHISPQAREVWLSLAPELESKGLLAPRYLASFEVFCDALVQWRTASRLLTQTGPVIASARGDGQIVTNPVSREFARYACIVRAFGSDFALTPAAVSAMARGTPDQPESAADRLLG